MGGLAASLSALALASCGLIRNAPPTPPVFVFAPTGEAGGESGITLHPGAGSPTPTEWNVYPVTPSATAEGEQGPTVVDGLYTIQPGDTLWDISVALGIPLEELIAANSNIDPDLLLPENTIIIPGFSGTAEAPAPTQISTATPGPGETPPSAYYAPEEGGKLLLYEQPNTRSPVITLLGEGTPLYIVGRTGDSGWLQVIVQPAELIGWVVARWVDVMIPVETVPVVDISQEVVPTAPRPLVTPTLRPTATATLATARPQVTVTATATRPTATPTPRPPTETPPPVMVTATPAPTLPNLEARDYPYITNITENARAIFLLGRSLGNRPDVFTKVGDSITANTAFLVPVGLGNYNLRDHTYLQPVVDYYLQSAARDNNSFANTSLSAKGGWLVWHTILEQYADPGYCFAGEMPLECEYRVVKPAVSLIMLGTNDVLTTPTSSYERGMRTVVETSLDMGVIPVLSTIPPFKMREGMDERVDEFNGLITALAYEYSVPLWDYWGALQPLPNYGLAGDGVHPGWAVPADFSPGYLQWGMTMRNLTALQALDAVWRNVILPAEAGGGGVIP
jgi:uncharacterized protein YraI